MTTHATALVTGPALRYIDETTATVWLEASGPAEVRVLGSTARTFAVAGHHFALVEIAGLEPDTDIEYTVEFDGTVVWPEADDARPAPRIRTLSSTRDLDLVFGSCRIDRPDAEPWILTPGSHVHAAGVDALLALSRAIQASERPLPDVLLMLGDQVYADYRLSPESAPGELVPASSGVLLPGGEAINFDEYTSVYRSSWAHPDIRWLMATVPSAMMFDDHEVRNNWNVSESWQREALGAPGWAEQIRSAYTAYWLYQHLGNLSPAALREEGVWPALTGEGEREDAVPGSRADSEAGEERLRDFVARADDAAAQGRRSPWSYQRTLGRSRLVVMDTRSGRVLTENRRSMFSDGEWDATDERLRGDCDHLLVATSIPLLLHRSQHYAEAWNEAMCRGAFGRRAARWSERLRRHGNLDQWAAFHSSFLRLVGILGEVAAGRRGAAPSTVLVLSGDVHHAYVARLAYPASVGARSPVVQMVCSPFRNQLPVLVRRALSVADSLPARVITRLLARSVGVRATAFRWSIDTGPLFGNFVASLTLTRTVARLRIDEAVIRDGGPSLRGAHEQTVAGVLSPGTIPAGASS